jgi:hypothetical protein
MLVHINILFKLSFVLHACNILCIYLHVCDRVVIATQLACLFQVCNIFAFSEGRYAVSTNFISESSVHAVTG